jgi:hypothetical protein
MPWLTGEFSPEFAPEWAGSYLVALEEPNGGIRGIASVDIFRRAQGHAIVQAAQPLAAKSCIDTYPNFQQLALSKDSKDGASHFLLFLGAAYYDPAFTSAADAEDPTVIVNLHINNAFGALCARLVLDVLSGKASRDYACGIKVDEHFETAVCELRSYFGFFKLARSCETILRFYSYDGATNYVKCRTGGTPSPHVQSPEFMVFCLATLHLWGRIFQKFLRGLAYADDGSIIGPLSKVLKLVSELKPVFKQDANLDFNLSKTKILAKGTTAQHVFDRAKFFFQVNPNLHDIAHDFTLDMFTVEGGIEVLCCCSSLATQYD